MGWTQTPHFGRWQEASQRRRWICALQQQQGPTRAAGSPPPFRTTGLGRARIEYRR